MKLVKMKLVMKMKMKMKMRSCIACFGVASSKEVKEEGGLREFDWEEIERCMRDEFVIGRGGTSTVYKATNMSHVKGGCCAVKIVYGRRVFEDELESLRRIVSGSPSGIVKVFGYGRNPWDEQVSAVVMEYAPNGTVHDKLPTLSWDTRLRIALQVANTLDHLHNRCGPLPVVHGDLKASNILLDSHNNPLLCDFGSANIGFAPTRTTRVLCGSPGYTDPHYLRTGIPSKKNDVYSFGVFLLHLLTGDVPFTSSTGQLFPFPPEIDQRLHSHSQQAAQLMSLAAQCLSHPPPLRPHAHHLSLSISTLQQHPSSSSSSSSISSPLLSSPH